MFPLLKCNPAYLWFGVCGFTCLWILFFRGVDTTPVFRGNAYLEVKIVFGKNFQGLQKNICSPPILFFHCSSMAISYMWIFACIVFHGRACILSILKILFLSCIWLGSEFLFCETNKGFLITAQENIATTVFIICDSVVGHEQIHLFADFSVG